MGLRGLAFDWPGLQRQGAGGVRVLRKKAADQRIEVELSLNRGEQGTTQAPNFKVAQSTHSRLSRMFRQGSCRSSGVQWLSRKTSNIAMSEGSRLKLGRQTSTTCRIKSMPLNFR